MLLPAFMEPKIAMFVLINGLCVERKQEGKMEREERGKRGERGERGERIERSMPVRTTRDDVSINLCEHNPLLFGGL